MKLTKITSYLLLCLFPLLLLACSEDEPDMEEPSREELLIGSWKLQTQNITSITYQGLEIPAEQFSIIEDQYGLDLPEKVFSDSTVITFDTNNSYNIYDPQANDSVPGTWSFNEGMDSLKLTLSEEIVTIPLNSNQANAIIEELTAEVLTMLLGVEDIELEGNEFGGKIRLNFNKE